MEKSMSYLFETCFIISLVLIFVLFFRKKKNKHYYNIKNSKKIISRINEFEFSGQKINYLKKINPFVFEELLLSAFEKKGYKILRNKRYTNDGGIDGIIYNSKNEKIYIQAKRYNSYINLKDIKKLGHLLKKNNCKGFFIHTGKTGKTSVEVAKELNVIIISGQKLVNLITTI